MNSFGTNEGWVEADAIGFGCVLIKAEVLQKLDPPYFMSQFNAGEDFFFCWKARRAGGSGCSWTQTTCGVSVIGGDPPIINLLTFRETLAAKEKALKKRKVRKKILVTCERSDA